MHLLLKIRITAFTIILYPERFDIALVKEVISHVRASPVICSLRLRPLLTLSRSSRESIGVLERFFYPKFNRMARQYYGLCQYRRGFDLQEDDLLRLTDNDVDVVLPYPLPYEPDINAHHERYLKEADWNAMLAALKELQPEYAEAFPEILGQQYLYNYNLILAKKSVLRDYCEWLFPILERTEGLSMPKGSDRRDRYIGYMGRHLRHCIL